MEGKEFMAILCSPVRGNQIVKYLLFCVSYANLTLSWLFKTIVLNKCSCLLKMYLTFHQWVGLHNYTYKTRNHVNVYRRDVNFDFQNKHD